MIKKSCIYLIKNKVNKKIYIGSAIDFNKRFYEHKWLLDKNRHCNIFLQRAWNKYGEESFTFKPYLFCSKKDLIFYEQLTIDAFITRYGRKNIYNISLTAGNSLGRHHSEETKQKIGLKSKGRWTGKHHTKETKRKMSLAQKGRVITLEARKKISKAKLGKKLPPFTENHKRKISLANKGHVVSKETREKLRVANTGRVVSDETKMKISKAFKGKPGTRLGIKNKPKTIFS